MTSPIQESDVETQFYFFECLSDDFLNTLLHRVSDGSLINHISTKILENNIKIETKTDINDKHGPSIYVIFYENNYKICHLSIHLCPNTWNSTSKGPLHIVNNTYLHTTRRIRINHRENGSILFKLGTIVGNNPLGVKANKYCKYVLKVLNSYFNPKSKYYLGKDIINTSHSNLNMIVRKKNNYIQRLGSPNTTRKMRRSNLN